MNIKGFVSVIILCQRDIAVGVAVIGSLRSVCGFGRGLIAVSVVYPPLGDFIIAG